VYREGKMPYALSDSIRLFEGPGSLNRFGTGCL
jgi:hypothetical protein